MVIETTHTVSAPGKLVSHQHLVGIDSLRAVAAIIVVVDHLKITPPDLFAAHATGPFAALRLVLNCLFNGPAAVIIFFVLSGFFIHLPQTRPAAVLNIARFYVRRGVRIGIPAACAMAVYSYLQHIRFFDINDTVLWSVICEAIYYFLYPVILLAGKRFGWPTLVVGSYLIALTFCLIHLPELRADNSYIALKSWTWVVGLPCWILGCWLAENRQKFKATTRTKIWLIRVAIFSLAFVFRIAKFHFHSVFFSSCFTLNFLALLVAPWIGIELASAAKLGTSRLLEWIGQWSFSLYLMHPVVPKLLAMTGAARLFHSEAYYLLINAASYILAYCFYRVIEKPTHRLAIELSRRVRAVAQKSSFIEISGTDQAGHQGPMLGQP